MDPLNDLATFVLGRLKQTLIGEWLKFLFELLFSGAVSFLYGFSASLAVCGASLLSGKSPSLTPAWALVIALGAGAGWSAIALTIKFRQASDKLAKGMSVVLPAAEAAAEFANEFSTQTITKKEK
jgi:hypothetical protein